MLNLWKIKKMKNNFSNYKIFGVDNKNVDGTHQKRLYFGKTLIFL